VKTHGPRNGSRGRRPPSAAPGPPVFLLYAAALWLIVASFVCFYEEPALSRRFRAQYEACRRAVPAWWPHLRPWRPAEPPAPGPRYATGMKVDGKTPAFRKMARFNKGYLNRLFLRVAGFLPGFGIVGHVGRKFGRAYRTPVNVFRTEGGYIIALTYGS
jgi:hypothetical protein